MRRRKKLPADLLAMDRVANAQIAARAREARGEAAELKRVLVDLQRLAAQLQAEALREKQDA